jgi:putative GTP pyrophosphokinase
VIVAYDERAVEIQLRTGVMHEWAIAVEKLSYRLSKDLKSGRGPAEVLDLFRTVADAMALEERGHAVPTDLLAQIAAKRMRAVEYLSAQERRLT